jgi:hypothetical protein
MIWYSKTLWMILRLLNEQQVMMMSLDLWSPHKKLLIDEWNYKKIIIIILLKIYESQDLLQKKRSVKNGKRLDESLLIKCIDLKLLIEL